MQKEYKTVLQSAAVEYEEKKSRFIAVVKPVSTEEEALALIAEMKSKYWDASHHVYCYYIVGNTIIQRYSDDGEPSGTAGLPVLEAIRRKGLQNVAVVVTRYFGGTLLGAAGLIRAYGKSAALGIEAAGIIRRLRCTEMTIMVEYTLFGKVQNLVLSRDFPIKDTVYGQDVELTVYIPEGEEDAFEALVVEATNARALLQRGEKVEVEVSADA